MRCVIVQPWGTGRHRYVQASVIGEYQSAAEAYAALDAMHAKLRAQAIATSAIELFVVDERRHRVRRPPKPGRDHRR